MTTNGCPRGGWAAVVAVAAVLLFAGTGRAVDLTGKWSNGDATVSVRQVGDQVWWVAKSKADGGKAWTHVFHGKLVGKKLTGHFADVPDGDNRYQGSMNLRLIIRDGVVEEVKGKTTYSPSNETADWSMKPDK
jgi:hypothetical protein